MNKQLILTKVVNHLRAQKCRAGDLLGCRYLDHLGRKCSAGILIPPEDYNESFERQSLCVKSGNAYEYFSMRYNAQELELIIELQNIHDNLPISSWEGEFQRLATLYTLKLPNLNRKSFEELYER